MITPRLKRATMARVRQRVSRVVALLNGTAEEPDALPQAVLARELERVGEMASWIDPDGVAARAAAASERKARAAANLCAHPMCDVANLAASAPGVIAPYPDYCSIHGELLSAAAAEEGSDEPS